MSGINKVILVGRLGANPELRYTPGGQGVANFNMATSEQWTDKTGKKQERTEWHRIVVWGKLAELCSQYLAKGRQAYVEGRLQTRSWDDKEGIKRYTTEVVAQTVQFLGAGTGAGTGAGAGSAATSESAPEMASGPAESFPDFSSESGASASEQEIPF